MRKLASIRKISKLSPIEGADKIELATVDGWNVVVAKDVGHQVGDIVVYCEVDSFLPIKPEFEFLRKSSYRKLNDGTEGFRLKTIKLRGQVSQGLILPIKELKELHGSMYSIGEDVSELLGITKWDPPLPAQLAGQAKGYFPSFMEKTDEERIQNLADEYEEMKLEAFYVTEKLDGSSATFYIKDGEFGVCSRNLELKEDDTNSFWRVARQLKLEEKLKERGIDNICIQGELIGEGVQKNPYKIKGQDVRFFSGFNIATQTKITFSSLETLILDMGLQTVPVLHRYLQLPDTIEELIEGADGKSVLNKDANREGLVYRTMDRKYSFKVISNKFLLKDKS
jgi:RNA ligase (TIGR02306 family)